MSRTYDAGKDAYGRAHRDYSGQHVRHLLANAILEEVGADVEAYAREAENYNYRMGGEQTNLHVDKIIDNGIMAKIQDTGAYDAKKIAKEVGISYDQQFGHIGTRFDAAKNMYSATNDSAYKRIMHVLHDIAHDLGGAAPPRPQSRVLRSKRSPPPPHPTRTRTLRHHLRRRHAPVPHSRVRAIGEERGGGSACVARRGGSEWVPVGDA